MNSENNLKPNKTKFPLEELRKNNENTFLKNENNRIEANEEKNSSTINLSKNINDEIKDIHSNDNNYDYKEQKKRNDNRKKYIIMASLVATILLSFSIGLSMNNSKEKNSNYYSKNDETTKENNNSNTTNNNSNNNNKGNEENKKLDEPEIYENPDILNSAGSNRTDEFYDSSNQKTKNNFLFNSSKDKLTYADLENLNYDELEIAKSEIPARYGCNFINDKPNLQKYFNSQKWYKPNPNYNFDQLSELEKSNYFLIRADLFGKRAYSKNNYIPSDFIFPNSNVEEISPSEVSRLTDWEVLVAKNEIFARYGLRFSVKGLADHFNSKSWYTPISGLSNDMELNPIEDKNVSILLKEEKKRIDLTDRDISN